MKSLDFTDIPYKMWLMKYWFSKECLYSKILIYSLAINVTNVNKIFVCKVTK